MQPGIPSGGRLSLGDQGIKIFLYFALRISAFVSGYLLSLNGIARGDLYGKVFAFLDSLKPLSGTIDLYATRSLNTGRITLLFALKFLLYLFVSIGIVVALSGHFAGLASVAYLLFVFLVTTLSVFVVKDIPMVRRFSLVFDPLVWLRVVKKPSRWKNIVLMSATSTFAGVAYGTFYLFHDAQNVLISLRIQDGVLFGLSYWAQKIVASRHLQNMEHIGFILLSLAGGVGCFFLSGIWAALFCVCKCASFYLCARCMYSRLDRVVMGNQIFIGSVYVAFNLSDSAFKDLWFVIVFEILSISYMYWVVRRKV